MKKRFSSSFYFDFALDGIFSFVCFSILKSENINIAAHHYSNVFDFAERLNVKVTKNINLIVEMATSLIASSTGITDEAEAELDIIQIPDSTFEFTISVFNFTMTFP